MDEEVFNLGIRQFLKQFGVTAQREIEKSVGAALESGKLSGNEELKVHATLTVEGVLAAHRVDGVISLGARGLALALLLSSAACAAPFSELQSARLAGRGVLEITPSYSYVDATVEGESGKVQESFGVQFATGLTDRVDIRARIENVRADLNDPNLDYSATAVAVGPKFSLIPNQLALFLPVGLALGGDVDESETWQFHPGVIWTIPISDAFEVNSSAKALLQLSSDDNDVLVAFNAGLGIGRDVSRWAIRPEFGILKDPGGPGTVSHLSLGATFYLGRR